MKNFPNQSARINVDTDVRVSFKGEDMKNKLE